MADLVADSEDEEYLFRSKGPLSDSKTFTPPPRSQLTATSLLLPDLLPQRKTTNPPQPHPHSTAAIMVDNAGASTSRGEVRTEPEVATKKPRPKPKKKPPRASINPAPSALPSDPAPPTIAASKAAMTTALPEQIPSTESLLQDVPLTIADRAKSRARNVKSKPIPQDIIDIPSDEDERLLRLSPHRPKLKDVREAKNRHIPDPPPPSVHHSQESLVAPTSDYQPALAVSSQLPPSDPPSSTLPLPTSTPESAKKRKKAVGTGDTGESPSNPPTRWKRQRVFIDDEDDDHGRMPPPRAIAIADEPPPNFFASSSSLPPPPAPVVRESGKKKPAKRKQAVDDAPLSEVLDPEPPKEKKSRPKPKRKSGVMVLPEPTEVGRSPPISSPRPNARDRTYKSAEIVDDSDGEQDILALPPPPRLADSQSPLSDLSEPTTPGPPKPVSPSSGRKRLIPQVVITTAPKKRASSPLIREAEEGGNVDQDEVNGSPKGKKRQKRVTEKNNFDGLDDEVEVVPKKGTKGKGKAPPKGKRKAKPQPMEAVDDQEFGEVPTDHTAMTNRKGKSKAVTRATTKTKPARPGKPRAVDSDDEVTADAPAKDSEVAFGDDEHASAAQQDTRRDEAPSQSAGVGLSSVTGPETILIPNFQEGRENTPPPPKPVKSKSNPSFTPSSVSKKTFTPSSASSFARLNYRHALANEEKADSMAEIIRRANTASGTPSGIKSYSSFTKASRSTLRKIAPLHARRKTPPPLPPKPPPPKKTKKQLELEEKWEEELEETIEGWGALSSQERELLRKQKRDMEMGLGDW